MKSRANLPSILHYLSELMLNFNIRMKKEAATWFASYLTKISSNWILQLHLHLIWRKNSWNWILHLDLQLHLHLNWRKTRQKEYCNLICIWFDRKFRQIESCTSFTFDLTEKFIKKLNTATSFAFDLAMENSSNRIIYCN